VSGLKIGPYRLDNDLILAPMAGVTDHTFRMLCRQMGAGMAVSEMVTSDTKLWHTRKTRLRLKHHDEPQPRCVQIAGADPQQMAAAARFCIDNGAQIIDINMGCPAKKVCNVMAGSALMKNESLAGAILSAVVTAVDAPVTLKMRTGWNPDNRNAVSIARIAEDTGIQALTIHGRTRACGFQGDAEYDTIAAVKAAVDIPVIANGDIDSAEKAANILEYTGADGLMIGRAAMGNPWIFREIIHYLQKRVFLPPPDQEQVRMVLINHLENLYALYGNHTGVRVARKHISWYCKHRPEAELFRNQINQVESTFEQLGLVYGLFSKASGGSIAA